MSQLDFVFMSQLFSILYVAIVRDFVEYKRFSRYFCIWT